MTHDSCDVRFAPYALATRPILPSALRRQNDTEYNALVRTHLSRSADVSATIGRDHVIDLVVGNRRPNTVHFNFVVIANDATLGRPTIHQIAARTSVVSSELRVEALMPFLMAYPVVSFLRCRVSTEKRDDCTINNRDTIASSKVHVWMAPAWQEIIWRAAQRSLAVMCPACWCSPGGLLALMGSANRVLIIQTGLMSR